MMVLTLGRIAHANGVICRQKDATKYNVFGQDKKKAGLYTRKDRNSKHVLSLVTSNERPFYVRFADFFYCKNNP